MKQPQKAKTIVAKKLSRLKDDLFDYTKLVNTGNDIKRKKTDSSSYLYNKQRWIKKTRRGSVIL